MPTPKVKNREGHVVRPFVGSADGREGKSPDGAARSTFSRTAFWLMGEFGCAYIPLELVAERYLGLQRREALTRATRGDLPFPVCRPGASQKSPWMVYIDDLAEWLDHERERATAEWSKRQA
ncbi:MAG: pyocin activator PrtN family protein [Acidithiobacillus sp.]